MKNIYSLLTGLLLTASVFLTQQTNAQAPQKMSYQSVIRNSSNALLANTLVGIQLSVLQGIASGTAVYVETQTATTNANGLLSLQIGNGTATTGTFAGIDWANGPYFIKTETDPAGGSNYTITGTQEILSVPYALHAKTSTALTGGIDQTYIIAMQTQISSLQAQVAGLIPHPTVVIGTQTWTSTNLNVATYRDGTPIPEVQDGTAWANLTTGAWCYLNNDPANYIYGKMYNHYAVEDPRGLAPVGYHIPTLAEYDTMIQTIPMGTTCYSNTSYYNAPALMSSSFYGGTNTTGFSALNGGVRFGDAIVGPDPRHSQLAGEFFSDSTRFWSSDAIGNNNNILLSQGCSIDSNNKPSNCGNYIRLIKD